MGRRTESGTKVSLFPFLSILAALIGALVVIITGMAIIQLQKADAVEPEEVSRTEQNKEVLAESEELKKENDELRQLLETISKAVNELTFSMTERNRLREIKENVDETEGTLAEKDRLHKQLIQENANLLAAYEALLKEIEELKKRLQEEKRPEQELPPIQVRPAGSGRNMIPFFIETSAQTISILRKDEDPVVLPTQTLNSDPKFLQFLDYIDANPRTQIVFLVRNNKAAIDAYTVADRVVKSYAANKARRSNFRAGKLPLPGEGEIDLSFFEDLMK